MPATSALVERLRAAGAAAVVSGAGPSVLALLPGEQPELAGLAERGWAVAGVALDLVGARIVGR